jgi:two-component system alkaline phosphatase synthesis response regulator PhoP
MSMPHLLLVEDDPAIALMYETKLRATSFDLVVKHDGQSGWNELQHGPRPDLVLLDVVLPKKDGFEILRDLRRDPKLHDIPVILLTNLGQKVDQAEGKKLGASDYVIKAHITPSQLIEIINKHLGESGQAAALTAEYE